jgi:hypothetical protein
MEADTSKPIADPFLGKCIHGVAGAKFVIGKLTNPNCEHCKKDADE